MLWDFECHVVPCVGSRVRVSWFCSAASPRTACITVLGWSCSARAHDVLARAERYDDFTDGSISARLESYIHCARVLSSLFTLSTSARLGALFNHNLHSIGLVMVVVAFLFLYQVHADYLVADHENDKIQLCPAASPGAGCETLTNRFSTDPRILPSHQMGLTCWLTQTTIGSCHALRQCQTQHAPSSQEQVSAGVL